MTRYPLIPLGEILELSIDETVVEPDRVYRLAGLYSFGRGLFERPAISGSETKYPRLQQLHEGQFVYSRLFAWEGALGLVGRGFDGMFVSQEFPTFRVNRDRALAGYIGWLCRWRPLWAALRGRTSGLGLRRQRVQVTQLLATSVPLPTLDEQRRIVERMDRLAVRTSRASDLAAASVRNIDAAWWGTLRETFVQLAAAYGTVDLSEFVELNPEPVRPEREFGPSKFGYVDISAVENGTGTIQNPRSVVGTDAPSRARRRIRTGDVLISTVRPNLRGVGRVTPDLDGHVASTGFAVLRPGVRVQSEFLLLQVLADPFLEQLTAEVRGHYPAVNDGMLRRTRIVAPPVEVQERTIDRLTRLRRSFDRLRPLGRTRARTLEALVAAALHEALLGPDPAVSG
jgi:type I restriction enzyme S subunit